MAQALYRRPVRMRKPPFDRPSIPLRTLAREPRHPCDCTCEPCSQTFVALREDRRSPMRGPANPAGPPPQHHPTPFAPPRADHATPRRPPPYQHYIPPQVHPTSREAPPDPLRTFGQSPRDPQFFAAPAHPRAERVQSDQGVPSALAPTHPTRPFVGWVEPKAYPTTTPVLPQPPPEGAARRERCVAAMNPFASLPNRSGRQPLPAASYRRRTPTGMMGFITWKGTT